MINRIAETDVARAVVFLLQSRGHDVYQEVELADGAIRADIVVLTEAEAWVVCCKRSAGLGLMEACDRWRPWASRVFGAWYSSRSQMNQRMEIWANDFAAVGFGSFRVGRDGARQLHDANLTARGQQWSHRLRDRCTPEHRGQHVVAGTAGGERVTPFKVTAARIREYVARHPGCDLHDAVAAIDHHYRDDDAALLRLTELISRRNAVDGVLGRRFGGTVILYPK